MDHQAGGRTRGRGAGWRDRRGRRRVHAVGALVTVVLVAAACSASVSAGGDPHYAVTALTTDHGDHYVMSASNGALSFQAPRTNVGIGTRQAVWPRGQQPRRDAESCVTIDSQNGTNDPGGVTQEGVVLRLRTDGHGHTRAVSVTKNIYDGWVWVFNAHVWDTGNVQNPYREIGQRDFNDALYPRGLPLVRLPWSLCARVAGSTLEFAVWAGTGPRPSYDDAVHAQSFQLPPGYDGPGNYGAYIGHIEPGDRMTYSSVSANG